MQFLYVSVLTKLLNSDTFSNNLFPIFILCCSPVRSFNADRLEMSRRALSICVKSPRFHNAVSTLNVNLFLFHMTAIELTYTHDIHKQNPNNLGVNNLCLKIHLIKSKIIQLYTNQCQ
jgi:hypothetical protein